MGFRVVTKEGVPIVAETAEDAIALAKAVAIAEATEERRTRRSSRRVEASQDVAKPYGTNGAAIPPVSLAEPTSVTPRANAEAAKADWPISNALGNVYWRRLNDKQREAVRVIAAARVAISIDEIKKALGLADRRETSILLSRCASIAKACGLEWKEIAPFEIKGARADRTSFYSAGPMLRGEQPVDGRATGT